jgi:hypothetical protein
MFALENIIPIYIYPEDYRMTQYQRISVSVFVKIGFRFLFYFRRKGMGT